MARLEREGEGSRARIMEVLRQHPGINKSDVCRRVGLSWTTVTYHLNRLKAEGAVEMSRKGKKDVACYPVGVPARYLAWVSALRDATSARILDALGDQRSGIRELAQRLGESEGTVRRRLYQMHREGILVKKGMLRPVFERAPDDPTAKRP